VKDKQMPEIVAIDSSVTRAARSDRVSRLASFEGSPEEFWKAYLAEFCSATAARRVLLLVASASAGWRAISQWPEVAVDMPGDAALSAKLLSEIDGTVPVLAHAESSLKAFALELQGAPLGKSKRSALLAFVDSTSMEPHADAALMDWVMLAAGIPGQFAVRRESLGQPVSTERASRLYEILDLVIRLGRETRFMKMAYALCNELAARYDCHRVSLGWVKGPYVHLVAASHIEKFDSRSAAVRALESAMEEAMEQQSVIAYPLERANQAGVVVRAHEKFSQGPGSDFILTVPITLGEQIVGLVCLERNSSALTEADRWEIRLLGEASARGLADIQDRDRWIGKRIASSARQWLDGLLGPRNAAWKLVGLSALAFVLFALVLPWSYRVDSALAIRSKDLLFMPAPFDGYLRRVHVAVGDRVAQGAILVELDTADLSLEESMAGADLQRTERETQKAQGTRQLAEMQINYARQLQSAARLDLIRNQLTNAQIRAPYEGVVIEGDLKKNVGAPVRKGDLLLKFAKTEDAFIELEIDQSDVHEVQAGSKGEFALVGRPDQRFNFTIDRVDPVAVNREGRTVYLARARPDEGFEPAWRPGMGGSAKIEVGDRSLLWVMTHRTVRFLREFFWI
jgi:biotin carboxyl carrier protein